MAASVTVWCELIEVYSAMMQFWMHVIPDALFLRKQYPMLPTVVKTNMVFLSLPKLPPFWF